MAVQKAENRALPAPPAHVERRHLRRMSDRLLQQYEERYRALFDRSSDLVYLHDLDGNFIDANGATLTALGYNSEEITRLNLATLVDGHRLPDAVSILEELKNTGGHKGTAEFTLRCKDGSVLDVETTSSVIHYDGKPYTIQCVARDLATRKSSSMEEIRAEKLDSISILAGGIAHDFNNILTGIMGNIALAISDVKPGSSAQARLKSAEFACLRARDLTQRLLTFASGGAPLKKMISFSKLFRETIEFVLMGADARCHLSIPDDLWDGEADEGQVSEAIGNIVINARQAIPLRGGFIRIVARNIDIKEQQVPLLKRGQYVRLSVEDNGTGIGAENLKKIFDPFFTTKESGCGLGLSSALSIVKNHGGLISVESKPGSGSTFHLHLPASTKPVKIIKLRNEAPLKTKRRILVMDDEAEVRQVAGDMLEQLGYRKACFARDGGEAVKKYRKALTAGKPFDIVIIDLSIAGGMGGQETIKKLRELDPGVRAIVSSGYSNSPVMAKYRSFGFCGVLAKPYTAQDLNNCICRATWCNDKWAYSRRG